MHKSGSKNYYRILGVPKDADTVSVKKAYRRLAKKYHPDRRPEDALAEERFKEVQEAYEVLKDPGKRFDYDSVAQGRQAERGRAEATQTGKGRDRRTPNVVSDIFEFIKSRMEDNGKRGDDLRYHMALSFEEAALGVEKAVDIPKSKPCPRCMGLGWETPLRGSACKVCRGEGEITVGSGRSRTLQTCPGCSGKGILEKRACGKCNGKAKIHYRVERSIRIPPGVDNGSRLKLRGEGEEGENGGDPGDLYIVIQVKEHDFFRREHLDVWCEIPLRFTVAALGGEVKVPTLQGEKRLKIPPGSQSGRVFVFKGYGISGAHGSHNGDQKIRIHVEVPRELTKEEKKILEAFEKSYKQRTSHVPGSDE